MRQPIEDKVDALGLRGRVTLVGQQDKPEQWMQALDLFCLPSYANEGVPQCLAGHALAIAHRHHARRCDYRSGDAGRFGAGCAAQGCGRTGGGSKLMAEPELAARLAVQARQDALARFSRESMLDKMEGIFRNVCNETRALG